LGLRPPATIAADATIAPARAFTEGRASCHRRGGEAGQQVVRGGTVGIRRGVFVDPLPGFAQRPQHASADALQEQLHVGVRKFRLRVEHRLPLPRHPAIRAVQPEHMEVHIEPQRRGRGLSWAAPRRTDPTDRSNPTDLSDAPRYFPSIAARNFS
ncbi:MAG: hypothetical protein ACK58T_24315, partial [Phycisphaerae bacterium]